MQPTFGPWPVMSTAGSARTGPFVASMWTALDLMSEVTQETAQFIDRRVGRYAQLHKAMEQCSSTIDPFVCMMEFARLTAFDYASEVIRLPIMVERMSEEALVDMQAQLMPERAPVIE